MWAMIDPRDGKMGLTRVQHQICKHRRARNSSIWTLRKHGRHRNCWGTWKGNTLSAKVRQPDCLATRGLSNKRKPLPCLDMPVAEIKMGMGRYYQPAPWESFASLPSSNLRLQTGSRWYCCCPQGQYRRDRFGTGLPA